MPSERLLDRARGALLGTFVGDALGMPFEGQHGRLIPPRLELLDARLGRGTYTDDTQMMIALAESLIRCEVVDEGDLARAFLEAYDPRRGYGAGTRRVIELWRQGVPVDEAAGRLFAGRGSLGNGAAMRVAPVAVRFFDDAVVLDVQARRSARVTHAHAVGVDAAAVAAAAVAAGCGATIRSLPGERGLERRSSARRSSGRCSWPAQGASRTIWHTRSDARRRRTSRCPRRSASPLKPRTSRRRSPPRFGSAATPTRSGRCAARSPALASAPARSPRAGSRRSSAGSAGASMSCRSPTSSRAGRRTEPDARAVHSAHRRRRTPNRSHAS